MRKSIVKVRAWSKTPGTKWLACWWLVVMLIAMGCVPPAPTPIVMPASPLIPGSNVTLVQNRWRLVEIIDQGANVAFDAIDPIYFTFTVDGYLGKQTTDCNSGNYFIIAETDRRYRLIPGAGTARGCGERGDRQ